MNLEKNIDLLKQNFIDCGDFVIKKIPVGGKKNIFFCVAYIDMLVDRELIDTQIRYSDYYFEQKISRTRH